MIHVSSLLMWSTMSRQSLSVSPIKISLRKLETQFSPYAMLYDEKYPKFYIGYFC